MTVDDKRADAVASGSGGAGQAPADGGWRRVHVTALALIGAIEGAVHMAAPGDADILWGARSGWVTITHGSVPRHDGYSWSAHGRPWIPNSWGWNVVLGAGYELAGFAAFILLAVALGAALGLVTAVASRRLGAPPVPTALALAAFGVIALGGTPRATVISAILGPVLLVATRGALQASTRPFFVRLALLAALQIAWTNLHSGALLAPALAAVFSAGLAVRFRKQSRAILARGGALCVSLAAASLATPYGWSYLTHAAEVRNASDGLIQEWEHFTLSTLASPTGAMGALAALMGLVVAARRKRYERLFVLLLMTALTVDAVRFLAPTVILALPEVAMALGALPVRTRIMRSAVAVVVLGLSISAVKGLAQFDTAKEKWISADLVAKLPTRCKLFNDDVVGGAVILLRHDVPVWIDGRNDMYGRAQGQLSIRLANAAPGTRSWFDRNHITCALVDKSDRVSELLAAQPQWRTVAQDRDRVLLVRRGRLG